MKSSKTKKKQELQNRARGPTTALFLKLSRKAHGAPPFFLIYELGPSDEVSSLILFCCSFVTSVYFFLCVFFFLLVLTRSVLRIRTAIPNVSDFEECSPWDLFCYVYPLLYRF